MAKYKKKMSLKKKLLIGVIALIVVLSAALFGVGNFLVDYAVGRSGDGGNRQVSLAVENTASSETLSDAEKNALTQKELSQEFARTVTGHEINVTSEDGLNLVGTYYKNEGSHDWVITVHGYRGRGSGMLNYAQRYHSAGYQVVSPDLRSCGLSEGSYVGMGWPDRRDMLKWIDWIIQEDPQARIVMHGVSMGAATVMMTSGEETPANVVAFVEDCGYTSVWDIFASELNLRFHLPEHPVMDVASLVASMKAEYDFGKASSLDQVAKSTKPMLFIHGTDDDFVPFTMLQPLYDAKTQGVKQMYVVEGAGHGKASTTAGQQYWDTVFGFIKANG